MLTTALSEKAGRVMLLILTLIALVGALQYAQSILAPAVFAVVLGIVVSPLADRAATIGIPRVVIAGAMLVLVTLFVGAVVLLVNPLIETLVTQLPRIKASARDWIQMASNVMRGIETISKEIEDSVGASSNVAAEGQSSMPSLTDALWLAPNFVAQLFIFMGTLFFFVLTRETLYDAVSAWSERLRRADRAIAKYFAAVTLVNAGMGCVVAVVMMALGMDYAPLWGLVAAFLNFILYLGPMAMIASLLLAGMLQFTGPMTLAPAFAFLLINFAEAQFVTPWIVGQRLRMSPLAVFLAIVFGLWLWGPIGAIVALPVLLWLGVLMRPDVISHTRAIRGFRYADA